MRRTVNKHKKKKKNSRMGGGAGWQGRLGVPRFKAGLLEGRGPWPERAWKHPAHVGARKVGGPLGQEATP
jgi:hypothetical protein